MTEIILPWPDRRLSPNYGNRMWQAKIAPKAEARALGNALSRLLEAPQGDLSVSYVFFPPDRRKRDLDNLVASMKSYQDGVFEGLGIDDSLVKRRVDEWGQVKKGGEVSMRLEALDGS